ncbi:MAG TPA: response regulator [Ramlibacter sp.]|nr:response regulator [Ramlibacter sp.]
MTSGNNAERVFVKVVGFSDVERHALNTVFRLSEQRDTVYSLWSVEAPEPPRMALIDGQSYESRLQLALPDDPDLKLIWVGAVPPANAWRTFERPLAWPDVLTAMDELFAAPEVIDFDLDFDSAGPDTQPPEPQEPVKRALIASSDRNERLYLRAKLALAELTQADEAETGAQALELTRAHQYSVALVDFALPDVNGWALLKELTEAKPAIPYVIITKAKASASERVRAWLAGAKGCFDKPPHPGKLQYLLQKV